jgi:hypothetical protein
VGVTQFSQSAVCRRTIRAYLGSRLDHLLHKGDYVGGGVSVNAA